MKNFKDLITKLEGVRNGVFKFKQAILIEAGNEFVKLAHENFKNKGFKDGASTITWANRKKATNDAYDARNKEGKRKKAYKASVYSSKNPLLQQTGNLRDSIHYQTTPNGVFVGVNLKIVPYAKIHNTGGKTGKGGNMPRRKYLGITKEHFKILRKISDREFKKLLK